MNFDCSLYLVTDSTGLEEKEFLRRVEEACVGGVTLVQLREKERSGREYLNLAMKVKEITDKYNIPLIIDDRIDIAMLCDADGVHLGQSDIPAKEARKLMPGKIIGVSCRTVEEAERAKADGADYLGVGDIFGTKTKLDAKRVSLDTLKEIKEKVNLPVAAIGGLNLDNIDYVKKCNIDGYAVISAILAKENIKKECGSWIIKINN